MGYSTIRNFNLWKLGLDDLEEKFNKPYVVPSRGSPYENIMYCKGPWEPSPHRTDGHPPKNLNPYYV